MYHYFVEEFSYGEQFIVQLIVRADTLSEAYTMADEIIKDFPFDTDSDMNDGPKLLYIRQITDEEAEASGLDEY